MKNEKNTITFVNSRKLVGATMIFVIPSLIIAFFQLILAYTVYVPGMGIYDLTGAMLAKYDLIRILMYALIIACFFPIAITFYKSNGINIEKEFFADSKYLMDIGLGIAAAVSSFTVSYIIVHIISGFPVYRFQGYNTLWLNILSYVIVSGICKEVYFRGIPFIFLEHEFGEWPAFLFANICFTILDWPNVGLSFVLGLVWYLFYRKRGSLIIPVIGHGLYNFLCTLASMGVFSFLGIIPIQG
ncbi:MAG TPA: type II CAAX endopeptidase family protein [Acetivibrio sp.]|nr:type II CAAX endopeptidase family protein [Acetivibrio sp.]